jgi:hypothetical protein
MTISSNTPEGFDYYCPICRNRFIEQPSHPTGEVICPACGSLALVTIELTNTSFDASILGEIPESIMKEHRIIPLRRRGSTLFIATAEVKESDFVAQLSYILDCDVRFVMCASSHIDEVIQRYCS